MQTQSGMADRASSTPLEPRRGQMARVNPPYLRLEEMMREARLMIVDDEPTSIKVLRKHLMDAGYREPLGLCDPGKAIQTIVAEAPDLLLLDIVMPEISGLAILRALRASERFARLPVMILTASTDREVKLQALELGATDFLQKPVDPVELLPRIRNALAFRAMWDHCDSLMVDQAVASGTCHPAREDGTSPDSWNGEANTAPCAREHQDPISSLPLCRRACPEKLKEFAKAMIVDDEPLNIKVVRKYLRDEGYMNIVSVSEATEAFATIERARPDLVLLDIVMPQVSGLDILERIRADPSFVDLPVIILTASTDQDTKRRALDLGATDFLAKPVDPTDLLPRIRNALMMKIDQDYLKEYTVSLEREVLRQVAKVNDYTAGLERANEALRRSRAVAQAASRAKSEFLENMSHEIRTPMTAVIGFAEAMLAEADPSSVPASYVADLNIIVRNGKHLLEVVNDIVDLPRIESGQLAVTIVSCSPAELVRDVINAMRIQADAKGICLSAECINPVPSRIQTDRTYVRRILYNLVGNAIKFTEKGAVTVRMCLVTAEDNDPLLQFEIIDTGIGISKDQESRLFRRFVQADASVARRFGGTGLGLTITKRLVEKLGGTMSMDSEAGCGTAFRFRIPTGRLDGVGMLSDPFAGPEGRADTDDPRSGGPPLQRLDCRILLAEDCTDNQRLFTRVLDRAGAKVVVAENGQVAYEKAIGALESGSPFDLVLMDLNMPVADGYLATRMLRNEGYALPIIALTACATSGAWEKCRDAGLDGYVTKPINREELLATIARHVADRPAQESVRS